jgi:micrococcal nuclease
MDLLSRLSWKHCLLVAIAVLICSPVRSKGAQGPETASVLEIVDGDTLKVGYRGTEEMVRLIGIDAPESGPNEKAKEDARRSGEDVKAITAMGKEAMGYVKTLVKPGDTVGIGIDAQKRDKYRRLLAYVYLSDGKMLNEEIVRAGYANLMTHPPNVKYQEKVSKVYREARENGRGLWR